jgi:hypothetical protein
MGEHEKPRPHETVVKLLLQRRHFREMEGERDAILLDPLLHYAAIPLTSCIY